MDTRFYETKIVSEFFLQWFRALTDTTYMKGNTTPHEASNYPIGLLISERYQVVDLLGWGSAGLVLKVADTMLNGEMVALKVLLRESSADEVTRARMRREVILARKLAHPNIVRVYDVGITHLGDPFVSMEYVDGVTLHQAIAMGTLSPEEAIEHLYDIVEGLECAHEHEIIHRDLKPANIMITADGVVKITDFGLARGFDHNEKLTMPDEMIGSPLFIAPEIVTTSKADKRSDIYSLGAIAYTMVQGEPPFFHPNWAVLAHMHVSVATPHISSARVPVWYDELVQRCMEKDPEARFSSARSLRQWLEKRLKKGAPAQGRKLLRIMATVVALAMLFMLGIAVSTRFEAF